MAVGCAEASEVESRVGWSNLARHVKGSKNTRGDSC